MSDQTSELAALKAENAALWEVHAACVKAIDDLGALARTPPPTSAAEATAAILGCMAPIAAVLDVVRTVKTHRQGNAPALPADEAASWVYAHLRCPCKAEPKGCPACLNDTIEIIHGIYFPGVDMPAYSVGRVT